MQKEMAKPEKQPEFLKQSCLASRRQGGGNGGTATVAAMTQPSV